MELKKRAVLGAVLCACVLAGAGIEHLRLALAGPEAEEVEVKEVVRVTKTPGRVVTVRDETAERAAEALRVRVGELENTLALRDAEREQQVERQVQPGTDSEARGRRQSWEERMERMKAESPERYAEMQQRREEFRQQMEQRARDRADFLDAVDVAGMRPEQRSNHEKLLETVARIDELRAQMMQPENAAGEDRDALRQEMGETMAALGQLYSAERQYLLEATAKAAGCSGNDVSAFTEHIQTIIENTTMMPGMGRSRGGGGGGGGPPSP
jgi:hypothetical protein